MCILRRIGRVILLMVNVVCVCGLIKVCCVCDLRCGCVIRFFIGYDVL